MTMLAPLLEMFFTDRLIRQRRVSPNTVAAYRDTFRTLLAFTKDRLGKSPSQLLLTDLDAALIGRFLDHLETERNNCARSRNARLAAIRSFFHFAALEEPAHSGMIERVLAIPQKRFVRYVIDFLSEDEVNALLEAPDQNTYLGQRDHALLLLVLLTGLRVSEVINLTCESVVMGHGAHVRCLGKGRKERCTPIGRQGVDVLKAWLRLRKGQPTDPLFPSLRGSFMSRDAVERLVKKYVTVATSSCPSLNSKHVSPHTLRHTNAVRLLQAGVDRSVIALWLGHEQIETTQMYLHADLSMKEKALAKTATIATKVGRYRPSDTLLAFLEGL
jgi:site-specific recombinase XerD